MDLTAAIAGFLEEIAVKNPAIGLLLALLIASNVAQWFDRLKEKKDHDATRKAFDDYKSVRVAQLEEELEDARKESEFWRNKIETGGAKVGARR